MRFVSNIAFLSLFCMLSAICYADTVTSSPISNAVTAKDVKGVALTPEDVTSTFPPNQNVFHTIVTVDNLPENTKVKAVWLDTQGKKMGEYEISAAGTRNLDFSFTPTDGHLPTGDYTVNLFVNGNLDRTVKFSVADPLSTSTTTTPVHGQYIDSITMALGTTGEEKMPENITSIFKPTNTFHAVVRTNNAPANTRFKATWYLVKSNSSEYAPNSLIDSTEITTDGTRYIDFTLKPTSKMPEGTYRVEFSVNGVIDPLSATFVVKE